MTSSTLLTSERHTWYTLQPTSDSRTQNSFKPIPIYNIGLGFTMEDTRSRSRGPLSDDRRVGKHHRKAQTPSVKRRNERERNRVKLVNRGFTLLQKHVPGLAMTPSKKLSKVDTLRSAVDYIRYLQSMLDGADKLERCHKGAAAASSGHEVSTETEARVPPSYQPVHLYTTPSPTPSYSDLSSPFQLESYPSQESDPGYSSSSYISSSPGHPQPCSPGQYHQKSLSPIHYPNSPPNYQSPTSYRSPPAHQYDEGPSRTEYTTVRSYFDEASPASTGMDSLHEDDLAILSAWIV